MRFFTLLSLAFTLGTSLALANPVKITHHGLQTDEGSLTFELRQYINEFGEPEVAVDFIEERLFLNTTLPVIYGRDLDLDGFYDAWFLLGRGGEVRALERAARLEEGWDVIFYLLRDELQIQTRNVLDPFSHFIVSYAFNSQSALEGFVQKISRLQIDLRDREIRLLRALREDKMNPIPLKQMIQLGEDWNELAEVLVPNEKFYYFKNLLLDGVILVFAKYVATGGKLLGQGVWKSATTRLAWANATDQYIAKAYNNAVKKGRKIKETLTEKFHVRKPEKLSPPEPPTMTLSSAAKFLYDAGRTLKGFQTKTTLARVLSGSFRIANQFWKNRAFSGSYVANSQISRLKEKYLGENTTTLISDRPWVLEKEISSAEELYHSLAALSGGLRYEIDITPMQRDLQKKEAVFAVVYGNEQGEMTLIARGPTQPLQIPFTSFKEIGLRDSRFVVDFGTLKKYHEGILISESTDKEFTGYALVSKHPLTSYAFHAVMVSELKSKAIAQAIQAEGELRLDLEVLRKATTEGWEAEALDFKAIPVFSKKK